MPNTAKGTPYVVSTDLVANYPTVSSDLADHIDDNLAYNAVTINAQTGTTYTFALADASEGKLVTASNAAASTYTVPPQSSVTWANGAVLRILNQGAGTVTIAAGSGVTINGTPLTLAQYKGAAIQRTASNTWTFVPFSGGVGNANFSDAATGTYSSGGDNWKYITYTASGTLTVTEAGLADVLVVGGGAGGGTARGGGGGAGGHLEISNAYLPSGTLTVTVGSGGAGGLHTGTGVLSINGQNGNASRVGSYYAPGGGGGATLAVTPVSAVGYANRGSNGASGGGESGWGAGGGDLGFSGGLGVSGIGSDGGSGNSDAGGGGGGASAVGANATSGTAGNGGAGVANSYTGSSVTRAGGGGGGGNTAGSGGSGGGGAGGGSTTSGTAGTANTGGGGGGTRSDSDSQKGGAGGSGIVIIRVRT
jgi:hypothetical protein